MWAAEDYFHIDLAEIGHLISPGKSHCMTYRREGSRYVKYPNGGYRVHRFTRWVSARLTRRQPDALTVQITSKMNPDANPARGRITTVKGPCACSIGRGTCIAGSAPASNTAPLARSRRNGR
ncbi:hypothetical protein GMDG_09034 [Pseudogymnoascus destructans 20631-21]|uniref:Uncharacterized protein n=1 Tax=Pseudogymnoascus destructans (strain ATCC MYA-4855 / 20631-21) TaxID=658429 RepID=L8FV38_PSED2|nr:hypothetical protein GMDG_09034 [Pseudogymnoascus destructans 20631-21]